MPTVSVEGLDWANLLAPLIVAVLVGVGASYVTTKMQISSIVERVARNEDEVARLRSRANERRSETSYLKTRLVRLETKIDMLLESQGINRSSAPFKKLDDQRKQQNRDQSRSQ